MAQIIYSRLWKATDLVGNSRLFGTLVRGAAAWVGIPHSPDLVDFCATRPAILDALVLEDGMVLDEVLKQFALDPQAGPAMDNLLITAATQYRDATMTSEPTQGA